MTKRKYNSDVLARVLSGSWNSGGGDSNLVVTLNGSSIQQGTGISGDGKSNFDKFLDTVIDRGYDPTYLEPILRSTGNLLINSSAGSGKTTTLLLKVLGDFMSGRMMERNADGVPVFLPVWVGTFLKSGQKDLQRQLRVKCDMLPGKVDLSARVHVNTLHSEFYSVCQQLGYSVDIIDDSENRALFSKAMRTCGKAFGKAAMDDAYAHMANIRGSLDIPVDYAAVLREWKNLRYGAGKMDFEDMQEIIYQLAVVEHREEIRDMLSTRYRRIYLDEFQDVSRIQYEILRVYGESKGIEEVDGPLLRDRSKGAIIAIGDDDQSIYSWRGADVSFLTERYPEDFHAHVFQNPKNYRTPSIILDAIKPSIEKNTVRYSKPLESARKGGVLRLAEADSLTEMGNLLVQGIEEDVLHGRSVAVLVRVNSDGIIPAMALADKGIGFNVSSYEMTLSGSIGAQAQGILDLANNGHGSVALSALGGLVKDRFKVDALRKYLRSTRSGLWDINPEDYTFSLGTKEGQKFIAWGEMYRTSQGGIDLLISILDSILADLQGKNLSPWNMRRRSLYEGIRSIAIRMKTMKSGAKIGDVIGVYARVRESLASRYERAKKGYSAGVEIASVHEYKGREAQSVYVWNASRGVFPHKMTVESQGQRGLEEERRIFYIACTRAKEVETLLTLHGHESTFLKEMDLSKAVDFYPKSTFGGVLGGADGLGDSSGGVNGFSSATEEGLGYTGGVDEEALLAGW